MNKKDLINAIAAQADMTLADAGRALDAMTAAITQELAAGNDVNLVGFGKFHVSQRDARTGRNPATGEAIEIPAGQAPRFSAGKGLKDAVNGGGVA